MRRALCFLVLLAGCHSNAQTGPDAAFRRFVTNVQEGRLDDAWQALSHSTQVALTAYVQHQRDLGADLPADPKKAVLGDASLARPIDSLSVKQEQGDRAVLSVQSGGVTQDVNMVKEDGTWRIALDLPAS